jgi:hypothetical protein
MGTYEHDDNIDLRDLEEVELNNTTVNSLTAGDTTVNSLTAGATTVNSLTAGATTVTSLTQTVPYHLVLGINPNYGGVFRAFHDTDTDLNTLFVRTSPTATYDGDLISSTYWRPSISGVFQININCLMRSVNADYLVEDDLKFQKLISGSYSTIVASNNRRWGGSTNDTDARVLTNHNIISQSIYASPGDSFKIVVKGKAAFNQDIWVLIGEPGLKVSITKIA